MSSGGVTPEAGAARHSSDVAALTQHAAIVRGVHSLIWIRGGDAVSFLDALISQSVVGTRPGEVRRSLLLTPQGKMRAFLWILGRSEAEVGLVTQSSTEAIVVADLTRFRFRVDAAIEVDVRPVATLVGPAGEAALTAADLPRPGHGWELTRSGLVAAVPFTLGELPRYVLVGDAVAAISASAPEAGTLAYESVRIRAGEPLGEVDFNDGTISHELGPVDVAVDFTKGCYLGQELVARIDSRGRVNQNLKGVHSASDQSLLGAKLATAEKEVGTVTSSAPAPGGDGTIGLALVRHEGQGNVAVSASVNGTEISVTINDLPFDT